MKKMRIVATFVVLAVLVAAGCRSASGPAAWRTGHCPPTTSYYPTYGMAAPSPMYVAPSTGDYVPPGAYVTSPGPASQ
jgi:hypothetical protein